VIFGKLALATHLPVTSILAVRFGIAAVILATVLAALRRPLVAEKGERGGAIILAVCGYAVESACFFSALRYGTAAAVTLLFFTYPVFVAVASWITGGGRPAGLTVLALALAVAGAGIMVGAGHRLSIRTAGVLFALASAITYTGYLVGADRILRKTAPLTSSMWVSAGASVGLAAIAIASGEGRFPAGWTDWWPLVAMGVATAGAFVCLLAGLQRLGAVRTSIIAATEPLSTALLAFFFLDEAVTGGTAAGGALILVGAVVASLARAATPQEQQIP